MLNFTLPLCDLSHEMGPMSPEAYTSRSTAFLLKYAQDETVLNVTNSIHPSRQEIS